MSKLTSTNSHVTQLFAQLRSGISRGTDLTSDAGHKRSRFAPPVKMKMVKRRCSLYYRKVDSDGTLGLCTSPCLPVASTGAITKRARLDTYKTGNQESLIAVPHPARLFDLVCLHFNPTGLDRSCWNCIFLAEWIP